MSTLDPPPAAAEAEPATEAALEAAPAPEASTEATEPAPAAEKPALDEATTSTASTAITGEKRPRDDDPPPLPPGWIEAKDPRYNDTTYWYHADTKQTSWTRPTGPPDGASAPPLPAAAPPVDRPSAEELELILDDWVRAKRAKDFETADRIREGLRAQGIDPDIERPNNTHVQRLGGLQRSVQQQPPAHHDPYAAAPPDARADLERWAATPSLAQPPASSAPRSICPSHACTHGARPWPHRAARSSAARSSAARSSAARSSAARLVVRRWVTAKRAKDFTTADAIRVSLRERGIDPDGFWPAGQGPEQVRARVRVRGRGRGRGRGRDPSRTVAG